MLNTDGYRTIIGNVYKIAKPFIKSELKNIDDLRKYYLDFLENYNHGVVINRSNDPFITDLGIESNLINAFGVSTLDDLRQYQAIGQPLANEIKDEKIEFARGALNTLLELDPKLKAIFNLVIHSIFLRESSKIEGVAASFGGSTSTAIGVICISDIHKMTKLDVMEVLLHELTHSLVFIDELNYPLFSYDEIKKKENFARSAILLKSRPLDKVVHSIIVGTEILCAREKYNLEGERNVHPKTDKLTNDIVSSCKSIFEVKNVSSALYPRAIDMVDKCLEICTKKYVRSEIEINHENAEYKVGHQGFIQ